MNTPLGIRIAIWLWFFAALAAGRFAVWQPSPVLALPLTLLGLTGVLLLAYPAFPPFRRWVDSTGIRTLVLLHATRFVAFYFLVLYQRGELPARVALPGGIGGCVIALLAVGVAVAPLTDAVRVRAITIWNAAGVVELLLVSASAVQLELSAPGGLRPLTHLPLSLLPSFLYPLILASHFAIFAKLARPAR